MVSRGTQDLLVNIGIVVLVIVAIYVVIIRNPNALNWLKGIGSKTGAAVIGAVAVPTDPQIGETVTGPNVYTNLGDLGAGGGTRGLTWNNSDTSRRDNVSYDHNECARETTWFFTPGNGGGGGCCGEDASVKLGSHGGGGNSALVSMGGIPYGGGGSWKSEGPHGTDADVSCAEGKECGGSVRLSGDQPMGLKGISWHVSGATNHHEIWTSTDAGATWTLDAKFEGETSGSNPLGCPVPGNPCEIQDTLRLDGVVEGGFSLDQRNIVKIDPSQGAVGGQPAGTDIPTQEKPDCEGGEGDEDDEGPETPTPPEDGEDGEDGNGDGNGDNGGGGGGGGEPTCSNNRCTCANGTLFPLQSSQTCDDCTSICENASANQAKVVAREAREIMRNVMYNSFNGRRHSYNRYLPRQYGYGFAFASKRHLRLGNMS